MDIRDINQGDIVSFPVSTAGFKGLLPVEEVSELAFKVDGSWIPYSMVKVSEQTQVNETVYIMIIIVGWFDRKLKVRR